MVTIPHFTNLIDIKNIQTSQQWCFYSFPTTRQLSRSTTVVASSNRYLDTLAHLPIHQQEQPILLLSSKIVD